MERCGGLLHNTGETDVANSWWASRIRLGNYGTGGAGFKPGESSAGRAMRNVEDARPLPRLHRHNISTG